MNSKKFFYISLFLGISYSIFNFFNYYSKYIGNKLNSAIEVKDFVTSYATFNAFTLHGTIYMIIFLFILVSGSKNRIHQTIFRMHLKKYSYYVLQYTIKTSVVFVTIFYFIHVALLLLFFEVNSDILNLLGVGHSISILNTSIYYITIGMIYWIFWSLLKSSNIAVVLTIILGVLAMILYALKGIWTPIADIIIYDKIFDNSMTWIEEIVILLRNSSLLVILFSLFGILLKKKEFL